jgi:hypothetical protein
VQDWNTRTAEIKSWDSHLAKVQRIQQCFHLYADWLQKILDELNVWFEGHPLDPIRFPRYETEYKIQYLNWVCRGLNVPHTHRSVPLPKNCPSVFLTLGPLTLAQRKSQRIGPILYLLRWYKSLEKWGTNKVVVDALSEWAMKPGKSPALDFFLQLARVLTMQSWCQEKLRGLIQLVELAKTYSQQVMGKTTYSHPECRNAISAFLKEVEKFCV